MEHTFGEQNVPGSWGGAPPTPPSAASPLLGGDYGIAEPPTAPDAPPASKLPWIAAVMAALVLLGGGAMFAVSALGAAGGAASPEEAVDALLDAIENEDFITMAEMIEPGERRSLAEPVITDILPELERLGVFDESFDAAGVEGVDFAFSDVSYRVEQLPQHSDLVHVYFTGGEFASTFNAAEFPFGDEFRQEFGDEFGDDNGVESMAEPDTPVVLVEREGRWYFSGMYTIGENARLVAGERLPLESEALPRLGSETPEVAVRAMIDEMVELDLSGMIGRLDPNELQALNRYAPLFIDEAQAELDSVKSEAMAEGFSWRVTDMVMEESIDGDEAIVEIREFTVEMFVDGVDIEFTYAPDRISGRFESGADYGTMEITPRTLDIEGFIEGEEFVIEASLEETTITGSGSLAGERYSARVELDEAGACSRWTVTGPDDINESGCVEDAAGTGTLLVDQYAALLEQLDGEFPGIPVVTRETDGEWYVAPIGTGFNSYVTSLRQLEPGDFDAMFGAASLGSTAFGPADDFFMGTGDVFLDQDFPAETAEAFPTTTVAPLEDVIIDEDFESLFPEAELADVEAIASTADRTERSGSLEFGTYDLFEMPAAVGSQMTISLEAADGSFLDPLLIVVLPDGSVIDNDDADFGAGLNGDFDSQVVIDVTLAGVYQIEARSYADSGEGDYDLTIEIG